MTQEIKPSSRWRKGQSGNPAGRKPGTELALYRQQIAKDLPGVLKTLIERAKAGDVRAARVLIERVVPPVKAAASPVVIEGLDLTAPLTDQAREVLKSVAEGQLPPDIGADLVAAIGQLAGLQQIDELARRIEALEGKPHDYASSIA